MVIEGRREQSLSQVDGLEAARLSPDGQRLAFTYTPGGFTNVGTMPLGGGPPKQTGFPCWSPDGNYLAFQMKQGGDTQVMLLPAGGGALTQLTFGPGQNWPYSWSPDGDKIAFAGSRDGLWDVWWVSRSDHRQKQLTRHHKLNTYVRFPAWSPRGNRIVYEYGETTGNIYVLHLK
jgi:Tol biopolymer transport system component